MSSSILATGRQQQLSLAAPRSPHPQANNGETSLLIQEIEAIDPSWKVKCAEPIFEEAATKKRLNISSHETGKIDIVAMIKNLDKSPEVTFFTVMDKVFGK